jgi:TolB-like protein
MNSSQNRKGIIPSSRRTVIVLTLASLFLLALPPAPARAEFKKTKIAVLDFQVQGGKNDNPDMGKIVAEWFITALVQEGRFDVIERRLLEKVIEEQKIGVSGIVDEVSASKLGKVLGAKIVITGTVLEFQNVLEVNARILEVESSSIIAAENVKSSSGAARLEDLVVEMAQKIIKDFPLEGYIAQRDEKSVLLDLGQRAGIRKGMRFIAYKEGKVIKHPKTGEVLDIESIETGEIEIVEVNTKTARGIIIKERAPGAVEYGMMVRSAAKDQILHVEEEVRREPVRQERMREEPERKREEPEKKRPERKTIILAPTF